MIQTKRYGLCLILLLSVLTLAGCDKSGGAERKSAAVRKQERELAEGFTAAGEVSELARKLETASTPEETAALMEEAVAAEGVNIEILVDSKGQTTGWRDRETGALFVTAENLDWPKEMPATVPPFTAVKPNGITIDESGNIVLMFPAADGGDVTAWVKSLKVKGWTETKLYADESQIIYEGMNGRATLSVLYGNGSLAMTFNP